MKNLPPFREVGSKKTFRPPYAATGVRLYGFLLPADAGRLGETLGQSLDAPDGETRYRAVLPAVLLSFADIARLASTEPPDASVGWVSEKEMAFWVLAERQKKELVVEVAESLSWFIPYIAVDSPDALLTGREVEGFPKEMGKIAVDPKGFVAEAWALPKFSPETQVELLPVVRATPTGAEPTPATEWRTLEEMLRGLAMELVKDGLVLPSLHLLLEVVESILKRELSLVFLKQERAVEGGGQACYQAVNEAPVRVTGFKGGGLLSGRYAIDVANFDSHPMTRDLGLDPKTLGSVKGFWLDFDFVLECGRVVWQST